MVKRFILPVAALLALWAGNSSWLAGFAPDAKTRPLAHRGAHQTFGGEGIENNTCTAARIDTPTHAFLENTIAGMNAAVDAGAEVVELDIHLTPEGRFAVFHDWTLGCRTNGSGITEETSMARLKTLDIGYGYTADGGATFPFRGKGAGLMPSLDEVFGDVPRGRFLINFKSERQEEGERLAAFLRNKPAWRDRVFGVYGGRAPTRAASAALPGLRGYDRQSLKACLIRYIAFSWSGYVPDACRNTIVAVPINVAPLLWGFPHRFTARLRAAGSDVILLGPWSGGPTSGIDAPSDLALVPHGFDGLVWTNRILETGQAISAR